MAEPLGAGALQEIFATRAVADQRTRDGAAGSCALCRSTRTCWVKPMAAQ